MELNQILEGMLSQRASDLYITVDAPVLFRVDGELRPQGEKLNSAQVSQLLDAMMNQDRRDEYQQTREANFAIVRDFGRFRVSAFFQRELPGAVIRRIETNIPTFEQLKLPNVLQDLSIAALPSWYNPKMYIFLISPIYCINCTLLKLNCISTSIYFNINEIFFNAKITIIVDSDFRYYEYWHIILFFVVLLNPVIL